MMASPDTTQPGVPETATVEETTAERVVTQESLATRDQLGPQKATVIDVMFGEARTNTAKSNAVRNKSLERENAQ